MLLEEQHVYCYIMHNTIWQFCHGPISTHQSTLIYMYRWKAQNCTQENIIWQFWFPYAAYGTWWLTCIHAQPANVSRCYGILLSTKQIWSSFDNSVSIAMPAMAHAEYVVLIHNNTQFRKLYKTAISFGNSVFIYAGRGICRLTSSYKQYQKQNARNAIWFGKSVSICTTWRLWHVTTSIYTRCPP